MALPICLDPTNQELYHGANRKTNNTGELTALLVALKQTLLMPKNHYYGMHADSTYALGQALSTKKPRVNKQLVLHLRTALKDCRARHGYRNVQMMHVKAHSNHPRNDKADALAFLGSKATAMHDKRRHDPGG